MLLAVPTRPSAPVAQPFAQRDALADAFIDVVDAINASTTARFEVIEKRLVDHARAEIGTALRVGAALAAGAAAWLCANAALGIVITTAFGAAAAFVGAAAIHAVCALALFSLRRARLAVA